MRARLWLGGMIGLLMVALVGCDPLLTEGVITTTLTKTAPSALTLRLMATQQSASLTAVTATFLARDVAVRFTNNETMVCNHVTLIYDSNQAAYTSVLPRIAGGGTITCIYTSGKTSATVTMTMPADLTITQPAANATLTRSVPLRIMYAAAKDSARMMATADNGAGTASITGDTESDSGAYTGLHPAALGTGMGDITLTREVDSTPTGTGFASVSCITQAVASITVQWM